MAAPIQSIGQISIRTHDLPAAVAFYTEKLGLDFLFETAHMAFFMCGDVRLLLAVPENTEVDHPSSILYFRVDDIESAHREFTDRGVPFDDEPHLIARLPDHDLWMAFFRDPDRNLLGLMAEVRPPAAR
jgi:catechol 2,3-dioxygenase-like lactoylglutathione lyase family enzyme